MARDQRWPALIATEALREQEIKNIMGSIGKQELEGRENDI